MSQLPTTSAAARTALMYITVGALMVIWTGVWGVYLFNNAPERSGLHYLCGGLMVTGLTLIGIGLATGRIGGAARQADTVHALIAPAAGTDPRTQPITAITQPVLTEAPPAIGQGPAIANPSR